MSIPLMLTLATTFCGSLVQLGTLTLRYPRKHSKRLQAKCNSDDVHLGFALRKTKWPWQQPNLNDSFFYMTPALKQQSISRKLSSLDLHIQQHRTVPSGSCTATCRHGILLGSGRQWSVSKNTSHSCSTTWFRCQCQMLYG